MFLTVEGIEGAGKSTFIGLLEDELVIIGALGLKAKDLDCCTSLLAETQTCLYNLSVIENHQRTCRNMRRQRTECIVRYLTLTVEQEL